MKTDGYPASASPRIPVVPYCTRFFSPLLFAGSFPSISISALKIRAVIFCSIRRIDCKVTVPSSRIHLPAAALNIPRVKIILLCIHMPGCPVHGFLRKHSGLTDSRKDLPAYRSAGIPGMPFVTNHGLQLLMHFFQRSAHPYLCGHHRNMDLQARLWNRIDFLKQC